jgi:hypothetical protein
MLLETTVPLICIDAMQDFEIAQILLDCCLKKA